jgi:putative two-component system response regulator
MSAFDEHSRRPRHLKILAVDDNEANLRLLKVVMTKEGYEVITAQNGEDALEIVTKEELDIILLDLNMPGMDGLEVCQRLKDNDQTRLIPVVIITSNDTEEAKLRSIEAGADDFLSKPLSLSELKARTRSLTQLKRYTDDLEHSETVMASLALAIEARDPYTEGRCFRLARYARTLAERIGLGSPEIIALEKAGLLHDLGKIAIPDSILLKPGPLSKEEFAVVKKHPIVGEQLTRPMRSMQAVWPIIRHHHERMDGSGYPDGLKGDDIPVTARVLAVADVYDALTTDRPYRGALSKDEALTILYDETQRGWWDKVLVDEFSSLLPQMPNVTTVPTFLDSGPLNNRAY